jgi:[ribosomal protein S18]-alanine N-acetyltransferase
MRMLSPGVQGWQLFPVKIFWDREAFSCSRLPPAGNRYNVGMEFSLRDFRAEDFETLWSIDQKCFAPGIAYSHRELGIYIRRRSSFTVVAETRVPAGEQPSIVGFIVAEAIRGKGHIISIDVLLEARRSGVGSGLLAAAEDRLQASGCQALVLETAVDNSSALAFYKRHHFQVTGVVPRYYSNGTDALTLEKELIAEAQVRASG